MSRIFMHFTKKKEPAYIRMAGLGSRQVSAYAPFIGKRQISEQQCH